MSANTMWILWRIVVLLLVTASIAVPMPTPTWIILVMGISLGVLRGWILDQRTKEQDLAAEHGW